MITCREFVEFLDRYVEGELSAEERATFDRHMVDCPPCEEFLASYRATIGLCREAYGAPDAPAAADGIPEELVRAILEAKKR
jgi:anti-sigma factor RsiW